MTNIIDQRLVEADARQFGMEIELRKRAETIQRLTEQRDQLTAKVAEREAQVSVVNVLVSRIRGLGVNVARRECPIDECSQILQVLASNYGAVESLEAANAVLRTALGETVFELGEDICNDNCKHTDCAYRRILVAKAKAALSAEAVVTKETP